jgi:membrane protein implicated in regulation of membrane protease activity
MIYVYFFALVLGGILLIASMLLGGGDGDADHDGVPDAHLSGHDATPPGAAGLLLAFISMRFWVFFLAFFGLTGVVLRGLGLVESDVLVAALALGMGLGVGLTVVRALRSLRGESTSSSARSEDFVGKSGRILVAVSPEQPGKIRLEVRGSTIDLIAISDEPLEVRAEAVVLELEATRVRVARLDPLNGA